MSIEIFKTLLSEAKENEEFLVQAEKTMRQEEAKARESYKQATNLFVERYKTMVTSKKKKNSNPREAFFYYLKDIFNDCPLVKSFTFSFKEEYRETKIDWFEELNGISHYSNSDKVKNQFRTVYEQGLKVIPPMLLKTLLVRGWNSNYKKFQIDLSGEISQIDNGDWRKEKKRITLWKIPDVKEMFEDIKK